MRIEVMEMGERSGRGRWKKSGKTRIEVTRREEREVEGEEGRKRGKK